MVTGLMTAFMSVLAVAAGTQGADGWRGNRLPEAFALGSTTMSEVLYELGPADSAYLAGADGEGRGELGDNIVLAYQRKMRIAASEKSARLTYFFDQARGILSEVVISFPDSSEGRSAMLPLAEVLDHFGSDYRLIRHHLAFDEGELEAELGACNSPMGEVQSLLYVHLGLQVGLAGEGAAKSVSFLRFAEAILAGKENFLDCPPDSRK